MPVHHASAAASGHVGELRWRTNEAAKKLTVETGIVAAEAALRLQALNVSGGTSAGEITLGTTAVELVRNVSGMNGRCDLRCEASGDGLARENGGRGVGSITFTLTDAN